jgi:hypothetical protein
MSNPEVEPALCATCPNRSTIGRFLAGRGIIAASEDCAGPDSVQYYDIESESRPSALYIWPIRTQEQSVCHRDELLLEPEQLLLGQTDTEPKKLYIATGPDEEIVLMQKAVMKLGATVLLTGAMFGVSKRYSSKYYKEKSGLPIYTQLAKTPKIADQKPPKRKKFIII